MTNLDFDTDGRERTDLIDNEELLAPQTPPDFSDARALADAWRGAVRELGNLAGYPKLTFRPGHAVAPGAAAWGTFVAQASVPDLRLAVAALRDLLASTPRPGDDQ